MAKKGKKSWMGVLGKVFAVGGGVFGGYYLNDIANRNLPDNFRPFTGPGIALAGATGYKWLPEGFDLASLGVASGALANEGRKFLGKIGQNGGSTNTQATAYKQRRRVGMGYTPRTTPQGYETVYTNDGAVIN